MSFTFNGIAQIAVYFLLILLIAKPLGLYLIAVFEKKSAKTANNALTVQQRSGATYGNALTIVPPRIAEFGLAYTF